MVTIPDTSGTVSVFQTGTSTLTSATATDAILFSIATDTFVQGTVTYNTYCAEATNEVMRRTRHHFSCFNDAGTEQCTFSTGDSAETATGGASLSAHTLDITSGTDTITFRVLATCSLTETTLETFWNIQFEDTYGRVVTEQN